MKEEALPAFAGVLFGRPSAHSDMSDFFVFGVQLVVARGKPV
jgi:hypothetical protein